MALKMDRYPDVLALRRSEIYGSGWFGWCFEVEEMVWEGRSTTLASHALIPSLQVSWPPHCCQARLPASPCHLILLTGFGFRQGLSPILAREKLSVHLMAGTKAPNFRILLHAAIATDSNVAHKILYIYNPRILPKVLSVEVCEWIVKLTVCSKVA